MLEILRKHIVQHLGNNTEGLTEVLEHFSTIKVKRNEMLLRQGEVCRYVYFVAGGCLQVFVMDKEGNETTRDIVVENNWCSELMSFGKQQPASENIRAVEPCELCKINYASFQHLMQTVPQFDKVYKKILEASYANSVYRINTFVSMSGLERMQWLMEYRPALMSRLPSKLLASYLGIHKDVFSRLKAKL